MKTMPKEDKKKQEASGFRLSPQIIELLAKLHEIELEDFRMDVGDLEISILQGAVASPILAQPKFAQ